MMQDRQLHLSLTKAFAWLLWLTVVACLALAYITSDDLLAYIGLACSAAAATVHMRSFLCVLDGRVLDAYEHGRQVEREQSSLHSIR